MSSPKITYIVGAGASCNCIPIGADLSHDISHVFTSFEDIIPNETDNAMYIAGFDLPLKPVFESLKNNLIQLSDEAKQHASVDTLAKKLYVTDANTFKRDFNLLKVNLSAYFSLKQLINKPDSRYDAFFASILGEHFYDFPKSINVLTWNYDKQFEISYSQYDSNSVYSAKGRLNIVSKFSRQKCDDEKFRIIKLNGTAGLLDKFQDVNYFWDKNIHTERKKSFMHLLKCYHFLVNNPMQNVSALSFAWEEDFSNETIVSRAIKSAKNTKILVVIGYSFPFFNRKIDKQILESIAPEVIYVQDKAPDSVIARIKMIAPSYKAIRTEPLSNINQFLIPYELQ